MKALPPLYVRGRPCGRATRMATISGFEVIVRRPIRTTHLIRRSRRQSSGVWGGTAHSILGYTSSIELARIERDVGKRESSASVSATLRRSQEPWSKLLSHQ